MNQLHPPLTAQKIWIPGGIMKTSYRRALSVKASRKPDVLTWRLLIANRLQVAIDEDRAAAKVALQMSEEFAPEVYAISLDVSASGWGMAIASSDSVHALAGRIDWSKSGHLAHIGQFSLFEFLEILP